MTAKKKFLPHRKVYRYEGLENRRKSHPSGTASLSPKAIFLKMTGLLAAIFILCGPPVFASAADDVAELKRQIDALQKRVDELEAERENRSLRPGDRFHDRFGFGSDPFEEINRMREEMNQMLQDSFGGSGPPQGIPGGSMGVSSDFNLKETGTGYEIKFDMTGLEKEKVDVEINEHSITIKGEHSRQDVEDGPNRHFSSQSFGSFMKTIPLPIDADTTKVKTEKEGDTLVIRLPKKII